MYLRFAARALGPVAGAAWIQEHRDASSCCGIMGVVSLESEHETDARTYLLEGLDILRNRGYDSAGVATLHRVRHDDEGRGFFELQTTKYASRGSTADSVDLVRLDSIKHAGAHIGIAHTRWATHGGKTDENAHPHFDAKQRVAVVHNGVITNADELRGELEKNHGVEFRSETDTEVIAQLIGVFLDDAEDEPETQDLGKATARALSACEGTWGVAVMSTTHPDEVVVACNGSPMTIGLAPNKTFIASETAAFNRHTKNFIAMQDGEIGVVKAGGTSLDISRIEQAPELHLNPSPAPYEHWMLREICEQPEAIARALAYGGRLGEEKVFLGGLDRVRDTMKNVKNLLVVGCGTSLNAGLYGAKLMRDLGAFETSSAMDASEVDVTDIPPKSGGLLAISQSGETKDVQRSLKYAEEAGVLAFSVVNNVGSLIARTTKLGVYLNAGRENAVASTKAFTTQVTVLALITCWFHQLQHANGSDPESHAAALHAERKFRGLMAALQRLPISFGMALRLRDQCAKLAERLVDKQHLFVLGKGYAEPIAREGALKIKECSYVHAESFSGGAMKHGPFALISDDKNNKTPIIMIILDDEHAHTMRTAAAEVKARDAEVYVITDDRRLADGIDSDPVVIPRNGRLTALIAVLPLQFIAYELAVRRGINPDYPRHLAKSVTVD
ncbi:hypothetical protein CTAYLR_001070 [Chrysophaeum taylorii]|uniref:Glutamine--fructose-6-phosphate aminotransferase [isomerizing] n=1 Tax=Chrysophaeum taylorii TaxID=2483200 RepID=A0AAD7UFJ9_9STRA|nr:hypothetical protein CTAYLR_001070 [Chrysophaeum taylorii]